MFNVLFTRVLISKVVLSRVLFSRILFGLMILFLLAGSLSALTDTVDFVSILDGCVWETGEGTGIGDDGKKIVNSAFLVGGEENDNATHANSMVRGFLQFDISSMMSNNPSLITTATLIVSIDRVFNRIDLGPMPFYIANVDFGTTIDGSDWEMAAQFGQENIADIQGIDRLLGATDQLGYADVVAAVSSNAANSISNVSLRINPTGIYDSIRRDEIQIFSGACILRVTYEYVNTDPPVTPTNFTAAAWSNNFDTTILAWDDSDIETSYTLFRNTTTNTSTAQSFEGLGGDVTSYTDVGLSTNTTYYYWIKAYNENGSDGFSAIASNVIPMVTAPSKPVLMTPVLVGTNILVKWADVANETSYTLYSSTNNFTTTNIVTNFSRNVTNYYEPLFPVPSTYYFKVKANNYIGNSTNSDVASLSVLFPVHNRTRTNNYPTINTALAAAVSGDLIEVDQGLFNESLNFPVGNITLRATSWTQGLGNTNAIIDATGNTYAVNFVNNQDNIILQGFTIKNATHSGIYIGDNCTGVEIRNCRIESNTENGIYHNGGNNTVEMTVFSNIIIHNKIGFLPQKNAANIVITNNIICSNSAQGISIKGQFYKISGNTIFGHSSSRGIEDLRDNNEISDNNIYDNNEGIYLSDTENSVIKNNIIYNNNNNGITATALQINNAVITNNVIYSNSLIGIDLNGQSCKIVDNTVYGHSSSGDTGIKISDSQNNQLLYNTLYDNYKGIESVYNTGTIIRGNNIYNTGNTGITVTDMTNGVIELNTVKDFTNRGILVSGNVVPTLIKNNLINNATNLENATASLLVVTNNWWGSTVKSDIDATIVGGAGGYDATKYRLLGLFDITEGADTERLPAITWMTAAVNLVPPGSIDVTWNRPASTSDFAKYSVYKSTNPGNTNLATADVYTQFNNVNITNFNDVNVNAGTTYYYYVTSLDTHPVYTNESWYSVEASVSMPLIGEPFNFDVISLILPASTNALLSWDNAYNADGYQISTNKIDIEAVRGTNITQWTDITVTNQQQITYYLRATNSVAQSAWLSNTIIVIAGPPDDVTNLGANWISDDSINLSWNNADKALQYILYTNQSGPETMVLMTVSTSTTVTGLQSDRTYSFRIKGTNLAGSSSNFSTTLNVHTALSPPVKVSDILLESTNYTLTWNPVANADAYIIRYGTNINTLSGWAKIVTAATMTQLTSISFISQNSVLVFGTNSSIDTSLIMNEPSLINMMRSDFYSISPLTNLNANAIATNQTIITWDDTLYEGGYIIALNNVNNIAARRGANVTSWTDIATHVNTNVTYYVIATNIGRYSVRDSASASFNIPAAFSINTPSIITGTNVVLTWSASSSADGYIVYTNGVEMIRTSITMATDYWITIPETNDYMVKATNNLGIATVNYPNFIIEATPSMPVLVDSVVQSSSIQLIWNFIPAAGSYVIYRSNDGIASVAIATNDPATITNYTDSGLQAAKTYYYKIVAVNVLGNSPAMITNFTTQAGFAVALDPVMVSFVKKSGSEGDKIFFKGIPADTMLALHDMKGRKIAEWDLVSDIGSKIKRDAYGTLYIDIGSNDLELSDSMYIMVFTAGEESVERKFNYLSK